MEEENYESNYTIHGKKVTVILDAGIWKATVRHYDPLFERSGYGLSRDEAIVTALNK